MKKNLWIAGAIIGAALMMTGCMGGGKKKAVVEEEKVAIVKVDPAISQKVAATVTYTANLQAYKQSFIVPAVSATRIEKIYVEVGDKVTEGQVLVDLDKNQLNQYRVQLDNAEATFERMKPVYKSGGISDQQMDEMETNIIVLREVVDNFETNLQLKSPLNGIVTGRYNEDDDLFSMSPNKDNGVGILQVMEMERLKAYVGIPEQFFTQVYMGMPVAIETDVYPGRKFQGKVSRIAPAINATTRTFEVEITIPNKDLTLRPGMFARTTFNMSEANGVTVTDLAIQRQPGTNDKYIFVVENGVAVRRAVVTGRQVGDRVEIISGVKAGEQVVVAGMSRVRNGNPVEIVK